MRALLAVSVALAACSPGPRSSGGGADASTTHADAAAIDATQALCYAPSTSGTVMPGASSIEDCAIWNSLAEMTGTVVVTRDQTSLSMSFANGAVVFTGTVIGDVVSLTYTQLHDFEDGCEWRATETLTGTLDPTTCVLTLSYQYAEAVAVSNGACATPCSGTGTFSLDIIPILQ